MQRAEKQRLTVAEKREIEISLKSKSAESSADKLNKKVKGVGVSADKAEKSLFTMAKAAAAVSAALVVRQVQQYADAWTNVNNRLRAATSTQDEFLKAQQGVVSIAQEAGVSISGVADSYSRLAQATSELGISQDRVLTVTRNVALALKAGGATAQEVSSIAVQLGQGLGAGALQGDELRSVLESSIPIAKALAKEFNTTTGELKTLGANGELTASRVVSALEKMDKKSLTFTKDVSSGFTEVSNALTVYVGEMDESLGVTESLTSNLSSLAKNIDLVVGGATTLLVLLGAKYAGALTVSAQATILKSSANSKLIASELSLLKITQTRATQEAFAAVQQQAAAKRYLSLAANATLRSKAITNLAIANGRLIATQTAATAATTAYTAAAGRATIASRALSSSMAFIGGPVGLAVIAAAALYTFSDGAESAEEAAARTADEVNFLADSFKNLSDNQKKTKINEFNKEMQLLRDEFTSTQIKAEEFEEKAKSEKGLYSASAVKAALLRAEMKKINDEIDVFEQKQEALAPVLDLSGGIKRNFVDGIEAGENKPNKPEDLKGAGSSFIDKIKFETDQLRTELAIRRELQLGNITEEQARDAEELNSIAFNYEARRQAILDQEFQTEELRKEALALSHEQELLAIQSFEADKMAIKEESAQGAIRLDQQELQAKVSLYQGLTGLAQVFAGNSKKASKALMVIQGALSAYQIYAASEAAAALVLATPPGPVLNPALIPAAAAISLKGKASAGAVLAGSVVGSISGGGGGGSISGVSSPSSPSAASSPTPTISNQQTQKTINFVGLENFGPDDFIPMTKSQFIDYMGQDEDVNIAVNNGQQNATRIGAI